MVVLLAMADRFAAMAVVEMREISSSGPSLRLIGRKTGPPRIMLRPTINATVVSLPGRSKGTAVVSRSVLGVRRFPRHRAAGNRAEVDAGIVTRP